MSVSSNEDLEIIKEKDSQNLIINLQDSFSGSNKLSNDLDLDKSPKNPQTNLKEQSSPKLFYYQDSDNTNKTLFTSDNSDPKNKISNNTLNQKYSKNKVNPLLTDPDSIMSSNPQSPRKKKFTVFKMVEKSKYKKYFDTPTNSKETKKEEENQTGRERRDIYGNLINKKNKRKIKVSFIDEIEEGKPFASVTKIESYKKYNYIFGFPSEENFNKNVRTNCQCCLVY